MRYRVGNIGIQIHPSIPIWTKRACRALNRQLDGFQFEGEFDASIPYRLNLYDYAQLPISQDIERIIVRDYCYYAPGIYADIQQKIAVNIDNHSLNVWCSTGCPGISIPFLLQNLLLQQHRSFVHAAAIDVHGRGILLPAFGGVGKTSFIARAVREEGVKLLGDDMVIISGEGTLEPYLRPLALYEYHKALFPDFFANNPIEYKPLTLNWRIYNKARSILANKLGRDWHQPDHIVRTGYIPVAPAKVLPTAALATAPVKLDHIYILQQSDMSTALDIRSLTHDQAITFMVNVIYHEWYALLRFLFSWLTHRRISVTSYLNEVEIVLGAAMTHSRSVNLVTIPQNLTPNAVGEELMHHIVQQ
jgi:hypothetical protein